MLEAPSGTDSFDNIPDCVDPLRPSIHIGPRGCSEVRTK